MRETWGGEEVGDADVGIGCEGKDEGGERNYLCGGEQILVVGEKIKGG